MGPASSPPSFPKLITYLEKDDETCSTNEGSTSFIMVTDKVVLCTKYEDWRGDGEWLLPRSPLDDASPLQAIDMLLPCWYDYATLCRWCSNEWGLSITIAQSYIPFNGAKEHDDDGGEEGKIYCCSKQWISIIAFSQSFLFLVIITELLITDQQSWRQSMVGEEESKEKRMKNEDDGWWL